VSVEATLEVAVAVVGIALVASLAAMVSARVVRAIAGRRRSRATQRLRPLLVAAAAGEPLPHTALGRIERRLLIDMAVEYLGKVRGEGSEALRRLLAEQGGLDSMRGQLTDRSAVHRAHAALVLGAAGDAASRTGIEALLDDADFEVRATAVRSLGQLGDPHSVVAVLARVGHPGRPLAFGTVVMALVTIGPACIDDLLGVLGGGRTPGRQVAAEALGLLDAVGAVDAIARAAEHDDDAEVRIRSLRALGRLGSPRAVPVLVRALDAEVVGFRAVAARSLGVIGDGAGAVVDALTRAVAGPEVVVSVNAAQALAQLGEPGRVALESLVRPPDHASAGVVSPTGDLARTWVGPDVAVAEALARLALNRPPGGTS